MVATGFTQHTGLTSDPTAQFLAPPQESSGPIQVEPTEESRRLVSTPVPSEEIWEPDNEERAQFASLMTVGIKTKVIDCMGHSVGISSLTVDDDLSIGIFTKDYLGTEAYARAIQLATCAAGVRTIDGRMLYAPLSPDEPAEAIFHGKLEKLRKYHTSVIMEIYPHILNLDADFARLAIKLGKLKG